MLRSLAAIPAAVLVVAACAAPAPAASPAPSAAPAASAAAPAAVTVQGFAFAPKALEVAVGTTVTWTNKDGAAHTTTSGAPGAKDGRWEGQLPGSGGTFSFTFAQAGSFAYFCGIHGASMTGMVVVK